MAIQIEKPEIKHKYISFFDTEAEFNAAYPNFEEVNWSDVAYPQERPDSYRVSRRLSNMYHKNTPPDYKFDDINDFVVEGDVTYYADGAYIGTFNKDDYTNGNIRKTFFLEIVWGYSGWEWHDYERIIGTDPETEEPITETLKGGNLYLIKNIETVPSIIDGYRLQHINDFLNTQLNVIRVEGFDTENLIAANRAFKRGFATSTDYPKRRISEVIPMVLTDAVDADNNLLYHYFGYADEANNYYTLPKLIEADGLFYNNYVFVKDEPFNAEPIVIPNIKSIDRLYAYGFFTEGLKFKFNKLEKLTRPFMEACFYHSPLNLNDVFIEDTLKKVDDFSYMLGGASFIGWIEGTNYNMEISLDLTSSTVDVDDIINLSHFVEWAGTKENDNDYSVTSNSGISVDLNFNNKVSLDYAFSYLIGTKPYNTHYGDDTYNYHRVGSFERMSLNFNSKENYITSIVGGLKNNTFTETPPIIQVPNNACDDSYVYQECTFNIPMSYNFLNGSIASPREQGYGQFNDCTFNDTFDFDPDDNHSIQGLDRVEFCGIEFGNDVPAADRAFPYVVQNQNDTTYRYFDMCNSMFTSIPTQNIYIDTMRMFNAEDRYSAAQGRVNPFYGCSQFTDLSNVHLYYKTHDSNAIQRYNFLGCTNMTKSPHIHLVDTSTYASSTFTFGEYINNIPNGLQNLTEINLEYLENTEYSGISTNNTEIFCSGCTNLVYLRIGTQTSGFKIGVINLEGCVNLDVPTLVASLDKWYKGSSLIIPGVIWDDIVQNYPTTAAHCMDIATIEDIR